MELKTKLIKFRIDTDTDAMGIIEDECLLAFSPDSTGVFELGDDVEKFSGLSLKDAKAYNETPTDAYIYGLQNIMNGGKDLFFWNNGNRLKGAADKNGMWPALFEQLSHEGSHLARKLMVRAVAKKLNVSTDNEDWIKHDYGSGEYMWPTMGDHDDDKNPMIVVSEEQFVTLVGLVVQQLTPHFLEMAKDYLPELKNVNINEGITVNEGKFPGRKGDFIKFKGEYFDIKKTAGSTAYVKFKHTAASAFSQVWDSEVKLSNEKYKGKKVWVMEQKLNINEGIMYNVDAGIALHKNPYRYGSTKFFEYYNDLRALKLENVSKDLDMFLSSDIGKVGVYEGKDVLLDFPMLVEEESVNEDLAAWWPVIFTFLPPFLQLIGWGANRLGTAVNKAAKIVKVYMKERSAVGQDMTDLWRKAMANKELRKAAREKDMVTFEKEWNKTYNSKESKWLEDLLNGKRVTPLTKRTNSVDEAEYQGKKVELSKPMRNNSGGGKFKVYVKDPKSGNVRMIKFGADSGGGKLAVKLKDPKAKAAFKARHNCEQTKDKTTASYWSCRLPRYAKSLGLSGGGQWW